MTEWLLPFFFALGTGALAAWGVGGGTLLLVCMTLLLGVVVSMFTAEFVTRFLMKNIVGLGVKNAALFTSGVKTQKEEQV